MKNNKLLKGLLPIAIALPSLAGISVAITSCGDPQIEGDFVNVESAEKDVYAVFEDDVEEELPYGKTALAQISGLSLKGNLSADDLIVDVTNCDFKGSYSAYVQKTNGDSFSVYVLFNADFYLYTGQTTKFDLSFSHKNAKGHIQTLTDCKVEFTYYTITIDELSFQTKQTVCAESSKTSYICGAFTAGTTEGEIIKDLSNFYLEATSYSETVTISAELVPLYLNVFAIRLNIDNIEEETVPAIITVKNKQLPYWYKDIYLSLVLTHDMSQGFSYTLDTGTNTAAIKECNLQNDSVSIPSEYKKDGTTYTVNKICAGAFKTCFNLNELTIPSTIETLETTTSGSSAITPFTFSYIDKVTVDSNNTHFTSIANGKECNCIMEKTAANAEPTKLLYGFGATEIPNCVTTIAENAFSYRLSLEEIALSDSVTTVEAHAFEGCTSLTKANLNQATTVSDGVFDACTSLEEVNLGTKLTHLGVLFNASLYLTSIEIPATVATIADNALVGVPYLADIKVATGNTNFTSKGTVDGKADTECKCVIQKDDDGKFSKLVIGTSSTIIPDEVTTIGAYSFTGKLGLESIKIPANVKTVGEYAFEYCETLTAIDLSNVTSIGQGAFESCKSLKSAVLADSLTTIEKSLFQYCYELESIKIPSSCTEIKDLAFFRCEKMTTVTGGEALTKIGYSAFTNCYLLKSIALPTTCIEIGEEAFSGCASLESIDLKDVTTFGKNAFKNCMSLNEVDLSKCATVSWSCFENCISLTKVTLTATTKLIENSAFRKCTSLTDIDVSKVKEVHSYVFEDCTSLKTIDLSGDTYFAISACLFEGCTSLEQVTLPTNSTTTCIGEGTFENCTSLKTITIPANINEINKGAFKGCTYLEEVTFADTAHAWKAGSETIAAGTGTGCIGDKAAMAAKLIASNVVWKRQ